MRRTVYHDIIADNITAALQITLNEVRAQLMLDREAGVPLADVAPDLGHAVPNLLLTTGRAFAALITRTDMDGDLATEGAMAALTAAIGIARRGHAAVNKNSLN